MLKPLGDRVVIKMIEEKETSKGGILLPSTAQEKSSVAEIVAVGPGKCVDGKVIPLDVKVGDKVVFSKYAGTEIKYEGVDYSILKQDDILAIVE
ncbi:MAG: co-chaperone GroES [Clostridia bacterium]|nr:co-chaperone GroES [Clostridia bacterium]